MEGANRQLDLRCEFSLLPLISRPVQGGSVDGEVPGRESSSAGDRNGVDRKLEMRCGVVRCDTMWFGVNTQCSNKDSHNQIESIFQVSLRDIHLGAQWPCCATHHSKMAER